MLTAALAFASGALISALAFELFEKSFAMGGAMPAGLGLLAGAATFVAVDSSLDRYLSNRSGSCWAGGWRSAGVMPEAFEHGRPLNAFATAAGFFLSFVLAS